MGDTDPVGRLTTQSRSEDSRYDPMAAAFVHDDHGNVAEPIEPNHVGQRRVQVRNVLEKGNPGAGRKEQEEEAPRSRHPGDGEKAEPVNQPREPPTRASLGQLPALQIAQIRHDLRSAETVPREQVADCLSIPATKRPKPVRQYDGDQGNADAFVRPKALQAQRMRPEPRLRNLHDQAHKELERHRKGESPVEPPCPSVPRAL